MHSQATPASAIDDLDFAILDSSDQYARYFNQLCLVFQRLLACYRKQSEHSDYELQPEHTCYEAAAVSSYLRKLLYTIEVLRIKYTYQTSHERSLWVDLTESGFPNYAEITGISVDLENRKRRLREFPAASILKRTVLDHIFEHHTDPQELVCQLSERTYLEMLEREKLFLPFTPGEIKRKGENRNTRSYVFSWACYDFKTNRPYIHVMTFDQDIQQQPLETSGPAAAKFLETVRAEGSRAPDVGVLAFAIDDALESIHPKIIKRICLGPLYSRLLLQGGEENLSDAREIAIRHVFDNYYQTNDDFVLFFTNDIVFSKRQEVTRSLLSPRGKIREIFAIESSDPECYAKRASVIHHHVLLPHSLLQHIGLKMQKNIPNFVKAKKLTFDARGEVHGI